MAKAKRNPFSVLGFNQEVLKGLTEEQTTALIKSQHRILSQIHHPDRAGDAEKFKEIQEAYDTLSEDFERDFWIRLFMQSRKDQLAELKKLHAHADKEARGASHALLEFWEAYCKGTHTEQQALTMGVKIEDLSDFEKVSIFKPPPVSILMQDRGEQLLTARAANNAGSRTPFFTVDSFELRITESGSIYKQNHEKTHFDPRQGMPKVRKELIQLRGAPVTRSYYWKDVGEPELLDIVLIGSIDRAALDWYKMKDEHGIAGLIPTDVKARDFEKMDWGLKSEEFAPYLRFVSPMMQLYHYTIGAKLNPLRFVILGYVWKIMKP